MKYYTVLKNGGDYFQGISTGDEVRELLDRICSIRTTRMERNQNCPRCLNYSETLSKQYDWRLEFDSVLQAEIFLREYRERMKARPYLKTMEALP